MAIVGNILPTFGSGHKKGVRIYNPHVRGQPGIELDICTSQEHSNSASVVTDAIETNDEVASHVHREPFRLNIEGFLTDTPLIVAAGLRTKQNRSMNSVETLLSWYNDRQTLVVDTAIGIYTSMILDSFSRSRQTGSGTTIQVSLSFIQANFVSLIDNTAQAVEAALRLGAQGTDSAGPASLKPI